MNIRIQNIVNEIKEKLSEIDSKSCEINNLCIELSQQGYDFNLETRKVTQQEKVWFYTASKYEESFVPTEKMPRELGEVDLVINKVDEKIIIGDHSKLELWHILLDIDPNDFLYLHTLKNHYRRIQIEKFVTYLKLMVLKHSENSPMRLAFQKFEKYDSNSWYKVMIAAIETYIQRMEKFLNFSEVDGAIPNPKAAINLHYDFIKQ